MSRCFNCGHPTPASTVIDRLRERTLKLSLTRCITDEQCEAINDLLEYYEKEYPSADRRVAR